MPRIKVELPDKFVFATELSVRIDDINYGNHLSNDAVLRMMAEARVRFMAHYNYTELAVEGAALIMADVAIEYKSEGFYGDRLRVEVTPGDFSRKGFDFYYRLTRLSDEKLIAKAKTGMVFFSYETRKTQGVPEAFRNRFETD